MKFLKKIYVVFLARFKEFYRDKASLSWNLFFPFFVILSFYFIFHTDDHRSIFKVGVNELPQESKMASQEFFNIRYIQFLKNNQKEGLKKVKNHKLDMFIDIGDSTQYWVNSGSKKGSILEKLFRSTYKGSLEKQTLEGRQISYMHWVFPGIIALNIMFSCLWGVGWIIVKYRDEKYLKRLHATPLRASHFILGQMLARFVIVFFVTSIIFIVGSWMIGFEMQGSYLDLFVCYFFGVLSLISIGLLVSTRTTSKEFADGLLNIFSWPMIIFSGMWFSIEGTPVLVQTFSYLLPLTHLIDSTRRIMLEGASLVDVWFNVVSMVVLSACLFMTISLIFKWNEK